MMLLARVDVSRKTKGPATPFPFSFLRPTSFQKNKNKKSNVGVRGRKEGMEFPHKVTSASKRIKIWKEVGGKYIVWISRNETL